MLPRCRPHTLTGTQRGDTARRSQAHLVSHGTARTDAPPKRNTLMTPPKVVHQSDSKGLARLAAKQGVEGNLLPATLSPSPRGPVTPIDCTRMLISYDTRRATAGGEVYLLATVQVPVPGVP